MKIAALFVETDGCFAAANMDPNYIDQREAA